MKIILKADVRKHTTSPQFSTVIVRTFVDDDGKLTELGAQDMVTVPAVNAEKIADLINQKP